MIQTYNISSFVRESAQLLRQDWADTSKIAEAVFILVPKAVQRELKNHYRHFLKGGYRGTGRQRGETVRLEPAITTFCFANFRWAMANSALFLSLSISSSAELISRKRIIQPLQYRLITWCCVYFPENSAQTIRSSSSGWWEDEDGDLRWPIRRWPFSYSAPSQCRDGPASLPSATRGNGESGKCLPGKRRP